MFISRRTFYFGAETSRIHIRGRQAPQYTTKADVAFLFRMVTVQATFHLDVDQGLDRYGRPHQVVTTENTGQCFLAWMSTSQD